MPTTLRSSLAFINVPSDSPAKSRAFFEQLFGIELVPSLWSEESYHAPISADGIDIDINVRHSPQEATTAYLAVADLDGAIQLATKAGGQVVWGPDDLAIPKEDVQAYQSAVKEIEGMDVNSDRLGRAAVVLEPGGSQIGLVELEEHTHQHFAVGKHQQPLTAHQTKVHQRSMQIAKERVAIR
jgi:predicted enzyme related to lactoylglutathione lyase